jgi:dimethylargininase
VSFRILTRRPSHRLAEGALTFIERSAVDIALADAQHEAYRRTLAACGAALIDLPADDEFPDSTFIEDALLAFPECFVLTRPGTTSRASEPGLINCALLADRPVFRAAAPVTLDGGDVLRVGRTVYVGLSTRTNEEAVRWLGKTLADFGYRTVPVKVSGSLHLKTAVTAPRDDLVLANPAWADMTPFGTFQMVEVDASEPFAGNSLRIGASLFVQLAHPRTAQRLRDHGLSCNFLDISEFAKLEAGLTCMSVVVPDVAR